MDNESNNEAFNVTTEVTLDHLELGRLFGKWDSEQQANFLTGMLIGIEEIGPNYGEQLHYIVESASRDDKIKDLEGLAVLFVDYFLDRE